MYDPTLILITQSCHSNVIENMDLQQIWNNSFLQC